MTNDELMELSKQVSEAYNIDHYEWICAEIYVYLHEDSEKCFDLAVENDLSILIRNIDLNLKFVSIAKNNSNIESALQLYTEHNNDAKLATRVAILKALLIIK